jgi:uncharacterized OB-fold protein
MADGRALPTPTPETEHYWNGAREGKLLLQKCKSCTKAYFPPRPFCPGCGCREVAIVESSGRASLYSYAIQHRAVPGFAAPYAIAVVTLEEGPRMMTNIVDCPQTPEALQLDMPLEVTFQQINETVTLPVFRPMGAGRDA